MDLVARRALDLIPAVRGHVARTNDAVVEVAGVADLGRLHTSQLGRLADVFRFQRLGMLRTRTMGAMPIAKAVLAMCAMVSRS